MKVLELIYGTLFFYGLVICRFLKRIFLYLKYRIWIPYNEVIQVLTGVVIMFVVFYIVASIIVWICANVFGIVGGL